MATLTPQNHAQTHEHDLPDQTAHASSPSAIDGAAVNHQINGHPSQTDAASALSPNLSPHQDSVSALPPTKPIQLNPAAPSEMATETTTVTTTSIPPVREAVTETTSSTIAAPDSSRFSPPASVAPGERIPTAQESMLTPLPVAENIGQPILSDERNTIVEQVQTSTSDGMVETTTVTTDIPSERSPTPVVEPEPAPASVVATQLETTSELLPTTQISEPGDVKVEEQTAKIAASQDEVVETKVVATEEVITPAPSDPLHSTQLLPSSAAADSALPVLDSEVDTETMEDVVQDSGKISRAREEDDEGEPDAKRTKTDDHDGSVPKDEDTHEGKIKLNTSVATAQPAEDVVMAETTEIATPGGSTVEVTGPVEAAAEGAAAGDSVEAARAENWGEMNDAQLKQLKSILANLRKGRHSQNFNKPVDPVALNIPTYFDVVKSPMDLSTMDKKLKEGQYGSVGEFIDDLNLIVDNCIKFNGPQHAVSAAAMNLKAHFGGMLKKVPRAGEDIPPPPPKQRRSSFALPAREAKRRASRPSVGGSAASPTSATTNQTFALGQDGVPLTRRTSTHDGRPKREIHKPPPRDLPYLGTKPKKKKFQLELKFCEHILGELKRGRYADWMTPFANPVDPVALNIPDYHKHVKKPMDFHTISDKLQNGHYENAKEFEADVKLTFSNCYKFNGPNHPISQAGRALEAAFDEMWANKQTWIQQNTPASAPQSPEAESGSEEEEEEEEDDEEEEIDRQAELDKAAEIASLNQKIAELSAQVMGLVNSKPKTIPKAAKKKGEKSKKGGDATKAKRKSGGAVTGNVAAAKQEKKAPKPKPKPKPITMKEKSEIAERIGELSSDETAKAAELIKSGLRKIGRHDLADRPDEELEFDIEAIPDEVLMSLLKLVRKNDAPKETRPATSTTKSSAASKPKKNKPMGKHEQEDAIRRLHERIGTFQTPATGQAADNSRDIAVSSGDEEDSGSESEEE